MTERLKRICCLDGELVDAETIWRHYADRHPDRHEGDWDLACWPDGVAALVYINGRPDD